MAVSDLQDQEYDVQCSAHIKTATTYARLSACVRKHKENQRTGCCLSKTDLRLLGARCENVGGPSLVILAEGAIALSVTLSGGALFAT